jgi:hypothetical protein
MGKFFVWATRHNAALTLAPACVAPLVYLVYIDHYAVNSFRTDDWSVVPIVHAALHGHLSLSQLWAQKFESRLFIGNVVDVLFGFVDRLDLRSVLFFSAALLIASYAGLLAVLSKYLGRHLTPVYVLIIGVTWFSLADVENALWAFQVSWYLTLFFFVMMLVAFFVPRAHRNPWFAVAAVLACTASLTTIQGFLCWPLGAICILWSRPWTRRVRTEIVVWLGAMVVTIAVYLPGYQSGAGNTCLVRTQCTAASMVHHPGTALEFFLTLIGNVIPGYFSNTANSFGIFVRFEVVGVLLLAVALFIIVQSFRHRASSERIPLPLLLLVFSLLFDLTILAGRSGTGPAGVVANNRYVMPNLILVTGIVVYAIARVPTTRAAAVEGLRRTRVRYLAFFVLAIFLVAQAVVATGYGLTNGRAFNVSDVNTARLMVSINPGLLSNKSLNCRFTVIYFLKWSGPTAARLADANEDQLGEFRPPTYRSLRELGPWLPSDCATRNNRPPGIS